MKIILYNGKKIYRIILTFFFEENGKLLPTKMNVNVVILKYVA